MDINRIKREIEVLEKQYTVELHQDHSPPYLLIKDVRTPVENWKTVKTKIASKLPPNYPETQPEFYLPADLKPRDGVKVKHILTAKPKMKHAFPDGPWKWWCVHELDWAPNSAHTSMMNKFNTWLQYPWEDKPWVDEITA